MLPDSLDTASYSILLKDGNSDLKNASNQNLSITDESHLINWQTESQLSAIKEHRLECEEFSPEQSRLISELFNPKSIF